MRYAPYGLIGVIGPWNYPLLNSFGDCIPALAAGNAVLLKPASATPLTSLLMAEGMREVGLPEDVLLVVAGDRHAGEAVIDAPTWSCSPGPARPASGSWPARRRRSRRSRSSSAARTR